MAGCREDARVRFWREQAGTSALAAYGLPTDQALAASANIRQRAAQYRKSRAFPGVTMDQLRVQAYLDMLNGIPAQARIACARAAAEPGAEPPDEPAGCPACRARGDRCACEDEPARPGPMDDNGQDNGGDDGQDNDGPADGGAPGNSGPGNGGPGGSGAGPGGSGGAGPGGSGDGGTRDDGGAGVPARPELTIPLLTLLGLAERPGEGHGLGPLDPGLARDLAATAARSPHSEWSVTVTDPHGYAIGHGPGKPARGSPPSRSPGNVPPAPGAALPARVNLTIPLTVALDPVPVYSCDHRYESHAYQPNDTPSAAWSGSATAPAPSPPAPATPANRTSSMPRPTTRAAAPVPVTQAHAAEAVTGPNSPGAGPSPSPAPAGISGPHPQAVPTPKAQNATRHNRRHRYHRRGHRRPGWASAVAAIIGHPRPPAARAARRSASAWPLLPLPGRRGSPPGPRVPRRSAWPAPTPSCHRRRRGTPAGEHRPR